MFLSRIKVYSLKYLSKQKHKELEPIQVLWVIRCSKIEHQLDYLQSKIFIHLLSAYIAL